MLDAFLVPERTVVHGKGDGPAVDISSAANRVFLLTLAITGIVEQESLDISVFGSPDGANWSPKPLLAFPQKFYKGEHPLLLDLRQQTDIKFLRAHWEVARWGRGAETPHFEFALQAKEVPASLLQEVGSQPARA